LNDTLYGIVSLNFTPSFQALPTCSPTVQKRLSGMVRRKGWILNKCKEKTTAYAERKKTSKERKG
jgi:hypothetical protein